MEIGKDMTRKELLRVIDEFKSERDAAKRDSMRAFDERNIALARTKQLEAALFDTICYLEMNGDSDATSIALNEAYRAGFSDAQINAALAAGRKEKHSVKECICPARFVTARRAEHMEWCTAHPQADQ